MGWITKGAVAAAVVGGGLAARRALGARRGSWTRDGAGRGRGGRPEPLWHVVTVNRPGAEVAPDGQLPGPLAELGDSIEVQLRPAPGDRGTEIAVRLRDGAPSGPGAAAARLKGDDPRWAVRRALRDAKQLLEAGEILGPSRPPTTERTLLNRPLEYATKHGKEEGLL
jgi:hypothetical protein